MATSTDLRSAIEEVQQQLPADQAYPEDLLVHEADLATRIERRLGCGRFFISNGLVSRGWRLTNLVVNGLATLCSASKPPSVSPQRTTTFSQTTC